MDHPLEEFGITDDNFDDYFFSADNRKPEKGQVMVRFNAIAELVDGNLKRDMINLLLNNKKGAIGASKMLQVFGKAVEEDCVQVTLKMAEDLYEGVSEDEVAKKSYKFRLQQLFYTQPEYASAIIKLPFWTKIKMIDIREIDPPENMENLKK